MSNKKKLYEYVLCFKCGGVSKFENLTNLNKKSTKLKTCSKPNSKGNPCNGVWFYSQTDLTLISFIDK